VARSAFILFAVAAAMLPARIDAVDFSGTYAVATPNGTMTLTLNQDAKGTVGGTAVLPGGSVSCTVEGRVFVDEDGESSVEGSLRCPGGGSEFELAPDEEEGGFILLVIPVDGNGTPRSDLAAVYNARPADAGGGRGNPPRDDPRDQRLVGVWATQVVMNTPGGSMATQLRMAIRADGTLVDLGSRSAGGIPGVSFDTGLEGGGDVAEWRTRGDVLEVSYAGSAWVALATFVVEGDRLLLTYYDGDRRLWYREG
jgi:hypothetical protein